METYSLVSLVGVFSDCGTAASGPSKAPESSTILLGVGLGVGAMEGPGLEDGLGVDLAAGLAAWKDEGPALAAGLAGLKDEGPASEEASLILFELSPSSSSSSSTTLSLPLHSFCGMLDNASSKLKWPIFTHI